jgi:hypothetical protein
MPAVAQLDTSELGELEQIERQMDIHVNTRDKHGGRGWGGGRFGWSLPPNIERAKAAHVVEEPIAAKESPESPIIHIFTGANVTSYNEALPHIRDRVGAVLKISYEDFDSLCDFAAGLSGKVFGAAQVKRFGIEKFFDALRGAGLRIRLEEDPEQTAKMLARISENYYPRQANQARMNNENHRRPSQNLIDRVLTHLANNTPGGLTLLNGAAKQARSNWARHAHKVRYGKA